jgi:hypothetical protein
MPQTKRKPVELTASAKAKLEKAKKSGSLGNIRKTKTKKSDAMSKVMKQIKRNNK